MKHKSLEITVVSVANQWFDLQQSSELTGIHPDLIREFVNGKLVECSQTNSAEDPLFDESGICRLRILADLREREKLSLRMMRVICNLMDRLERAETEVRILRNHQR